MTGQLFPCQQSSLFPLRMVCGEQKRLSSKACLDQLRNIPGPGGYWALAAKCVNRSHLRAIPSTIANDAELAALWINMGNRWGSRSGSFPYSAGASAILSVKSSSRRRGRWLNNAA